MFLKSGEDKRQKSVIQTESRKKIKLQQIAVEKKECKPFEAETAGKCKLIGSVPFSQLTNLRYVRNLKKLHP